MAIGSIFACTAVAIFSACSGSDDTTGASASDASTADASSSDATFDGTEVTNAEYASFVSLDVDPKTQPTFCSYNASFVPSAQWPATAENANKPVEYVDWCDAYAYCAWAGRRLCGNIGGGTNDVGEWDNGDQSEWFNGCTDYNFGSGASGYQRYPYSDTYGPKSCNGHDRSDGGTIAAGSLASCEGGAPGLYDMSGNVTEWEDSCTDSDPLDASAEASAAAHCRVRGGSFASDAGDLECVSDVLLARTTNAAGVGFRCCSR